MLTKAQMYSQMAEHVSSHITSSLEGWTSFLTTASKNYKYPYYDQLMIHAQRPDATACAEYDFWNDRMGRYVKRGSKGIALVDNSGEYPRLRYVFDISDTGTRQNSRKVRLWSMQDEYKEPIKQALEKRYGISSERLETQLEDIARQRANDYWNDFGEQFFHILDESFLMEYDEYNIEVAFKKAATVSITYMLYSRLTDNPNDYFEFEDFKNIFDFNTSQTANYLGTAVSEISSQIFREIEVTIRNYEQQLERSKNHDERTRIQTGGRLFNSEYRTGSDRTQTTGQIRQNEENFSQGEQVDVIQSPDFNREVISTSVGNRRNSQPQIGTDDARTIQSSRSNRTTESQQSNGVGGLDEQLQSSSGGNNSERTDLQLSLFPSEQEQIKIIDEAENLVFSAFSFAQKDIDNVLRVGGNTDNLRKIVVSAFEKQKPDIPDLLKTVYHGGNGFITDSGKITVWYAEDGIHLSRTNSARYDKSAQVISWQTASERIGELLESGNYATNIELAESESFERTELAQKLWYLYHDLSDDVKKTEILSSISNINLSNFPNTTENLAEKLKDSSFRSVLKADYEQFLSAYKQNRDVLKFHYHKTDDILSAIKDLDLPRKQFTTDMTEIEDVKQFITDDEIDVSLSGGSGFSDGKKRIYEFFTQNHDSKEKTEFLKNEYGTGGRSPALSGASGSSENHDYRGIKYQKKNCEDITLTLEKVSKRIDKLISKEIYKEEKSEKQEQTVKNELSNEDFINKHLIAGETTLTLENCVFQVESVNLENDKVELRDITFAQSTGFPIFRIENIETMRRYLENQSEPIKVLEPILTDNIVENFHITDFHLGEGGAKAKFRANIDAIRTLQTIESENRTATKEEQEILSKYVGWGGLSDAFDDTKDSWSNEYNELKTVLSADEYNAARASTLNAHYTSPTIIKAIYDTLDNMGFKSGNILEPSCGVGNFFGMLPEQMSDSKLYGVELDSITGRIAKQLYPKADITIAGFETTDRRDFYDLAIGNVPFGQYQVNDKAYNKLGFNIHNYFFAKSLDQIRSGGIIAFITSRYTMDSKDSTVRRYIAQRAELLGAIRLPNNAFKANAGTEVVSDIIFLQKRDRPIDIVPDWTQTAQTEDGFTINSYFAHNPQMILGTNDKQSTAHGMDYTVSPIDGAELSDQLNNAIKYIKGSYKEVEFTEISETIDKSIPADPNVKNYSYTIVNDEVYFRENSIMLRPELNATAEARVKGLVKLRDTVQDLISLQMDYTSSDNEIKDKQKELNKLYDDFTGKYGLINDRANRLAFADDSSYYLLCALEVIDEDMKLERKADMFTKRTIKPHKAVTSVDTASEALAVSISEKACVDMEYMANLTGKTEDELAEELKGVIFREPSSDTPHYVTADEYLSGNVRLKLRQAQRAANKNNIYKINVEALEKAQPKDLDASEIEVRLGATWIDKSYIQKFMYETFNTPRYLQGTIQVNYVPYTAEWQVTKKSSIGYNDVAAYTTYGTERANAYKILEDSLNLRDVRIYDTIQDADGKERRVLNAKETTLASQKQQAIREAFKDWIWKDPERRQALVHQYNEEMNSTRPREYDGSHITFGGMNPEITLREHQKNAIAHVLYGGNTLLAHEVGAGKTFEMVASAMESKRLGLCQKSLFVVPNHLTEQWASEFLRLYPSANILVTTKKDFEPHNRKKFCARIATGSYDAVIIGHSQFEKIPISRERQERLLNEQIEEITDGIAEVKYSGGERFTVKQLERTKKSLETRLEKLQAEERKDDVVTFEQLGVDRLFVDESHAFKNLFLYTKMRNVAGLSTSDAQKSSDMFAKCRYMDEITGNRGIIFATGTPVSNSMTELYTIQRYLQYDRLKELGMTHFDCWASRFGETVTALELAPEGTGYRARTRFSKFFNLPELMNLFKEVADIKTSDQLNLPTPEVKYHNIVAQPTEHQKEMVKALSERAAEIHSGTVDPSIDNMLKVTSDGRKLGLDQRIINPMLPDEDNTKVNQCVDNILQIWRDGAEEKLTQVVFCDISTPQTTSVRKSDEKDTNFTVYDDIRQKLIVNGMPAEQIAFIHDANTEARKKELFGKVRSGQVRVLMGSTQKMGAGTNIQDKLVALHDLDCRAIRS